MTYGATLVSVQSPDRQGRLQELTLGFDDLEGYLGDHPYFGATVGRYANRIENGRFFIDGREYILNANEGLHHLHGGLIGFNRRLWTASVSDSSESCSIAMARVSEDGEEGYPGKLSVSVTFTLTQENELLFEYEAQSDRKTPVNLTNHSYWNLSGPGGLINDHVFQLKADRYVQINDELIPTGELTKVSGTPMDFTRAKPLGAELEVDHCYVLNSQEPKLHRAALVFDPKSGRQMTIETSLPTIQFYSANMLEDTQGRGEKTFVKRGAFCLETGGYINSVNIGAFPSTILNPGDTYSESTRHTFSTVDT